MRHSGRAAPRRRGDRGRADHLRTARAQRPRRLLEGRAGRHDVVDTTHAAGPRHPARAATPATLPRRAVAVEASLVGGATRAWTSSGAARSPARARDELDDPVAAAPERRARRGDRHDDDRRARPDRRGCRAAPHRRRRSAGARSRARPVRPSSLSARTTRRRDALERAVRSRPCTPGRLAASTARRGLSAAAQASHSATSGSSQPAHVDGQHERERLGERRAHRRAEPVGSCPSADRARAGDQPRMPAPTDAVHARSGARLGRSRPTRYCGEPCCVASTRMPVAVRCQFAPRLT